MTPHAILRALVAGLLALIFGATMLLALSDVDVVGAGEPVAEAQLASVVPAPHTAVSPSDPAHDTLEPAPADHSAPRCVGAPRHAAAPAARRQDHASCPARGPPGSAP